MTPYLPIDYTAVIDMTYTERFFLDSDGQITSEGEAILGRLADELPDTIKIPLLFDYDETGITGLEAFTSIDHLTFTETEKLRDGLSLDIGCEFQIIKTIFMTIRDALAVYETDDGLRRVDSDLLEIKREAEMDRG